MHHVKANYQKNIFSNKNNYIMKKILTTLHNEPILHSENFSTISKEHIYRDRTRDRDCPEIRHAFENVKEQQLTTELAITFIEDLAFAYGHDTAKFSAKLKEFGLTEMLTIETVNSYEVILKDIMVYTLRANVENCLNLIVVCKKQEFDHEVGQFVFCTNDGVSVKNYYDPLYVYLLSPTKPKIGDMYIDDNKVCGPYSKNTKLVNCKGVIFSTNDKYLHELTTFKTIEHLSISTLKKITEILNRNRK